MSEQITLSSEQEKAAQDFEIFLDKFQNNPEELLRPYFVLEGFAGTGKSFCTGEIVRRTGLRPCYMTYTGKAALVLQRYSNLPAQTIHSTIYKLRVVGDNVFRNLYKQIEECNDPEQKKNLENKVKELLEPQFELNTEAFEDSESDLIVLDECSMVDQDILNDLLSFGLPILALGDPGQLPPITGEGALFKGMPDARLTEIRRQALDSPIVKWSMWARTKRPLPTSDPSELSTADIVKVPVNMLRVTQELALQEQNDVVICWKNKTRQMLNQRWRKHKGYYDIDPLYPTPGETLIITKNDKTLGIFNGQFVTVKELKREFDNFIETVIITDDEKELTLNLHRVNFEEYHDPDAKKKYKPWHYKDTQQADFGYAITCHKAQGSQWPRVMIYEENVLNWPKKYDERAQWLYTAITRAVEKVTILSGRMD